MSAATMAPARGVLLSEPTGKWLVASFVLLGGSFDDRFGRRRVFVIGTLWFEYLQIVAGYTALLAGSALLAVTVVTLLLSSEVGAVAAMAVSE